MDRKFAHARAHFVSAIASEPKNSNAHAWYGEHLVSVGCIRDGLEEALIGYHLDSLNPNTNFSLARIYLLLDDTDNLLKYGAASWDLGLYGGLRIQAMAYFRLGEFDRAIELAEQYDEFADLQAVTLKLFFEAKLDVSKKQIFLEKLAQSDLTLPLWFSVTRYVEFGRIDDAYRLVNLAVDRDSADPDQFWWVLWRTEMATFRQDPRFADVATALGLLDYWREYGWPDSCRPAGDSVICE
jgi:tetratricopeptide (TPR) repeat protein